MAILSFESDQSEVLKVEALKHFHQTSTRLKNGLRIAAIPFVAGAIGAFIPILHFVIVPAAAIAMIVLFSREIATRFSFNVNHLKCPHCAAVSNETEFERLPKRIVCFSCRVTSTLAEKI